MQALTRHHSKPISQLRLVQPSTSIEFPIRLIFLGPPGAGKGTQAAILANQWQIPHLSTGEMLRQAIAEETALGLQVQSFVEAGELVPDLLILYLLEERLGQLDTERGWILDGFPRNLAQAEALEELLQRLNQSCDLVVHFEVSSQRLMERMLQRRRADDQEDIIHKRLTIYQEQTLPVLNFYQHQHRLYPVNGNLPVESVTQILQVSFQPHPDDSAIVTESLQRDHWARYPEML